MRFRRVPSKAEFKKEFGVGRINRSLPFGPINRIGKILGLMKDAVLARGSVTRIELLADIDKLCRFVLKDHDRAGIKGKQDKVMCIIELQKSVRNELCFVLGMPNWTEASTVLRQLFGLEAFNHHQAEDDRQLTSQTLKYFSDSERKTTLLHFVNGRACRFRGGNVLDEIYYDTDEEAWSQNQINNLEFDSAPFVLSTGGDIYVTGAELERGIGLKHTSFMAGASVLAAGTIRCEDGFIKFITSKSGHYQPKIQNMLILFEHLRAYGVDLNPIEFCRVKQVRTGNRVHDELDKCRAIDFVGQRRFPGLNPNTLMVPAPPVGAPPGVAG